MKLQSLLIILPLAIATPAPVMTPPVGSAIAGKYIVKFTDANSQSLLDTALKLLNKGATHIYKFGNFAGFAAEMDNNVINLIRNLPGIDYIEQDTVIQASFAEIKDFEKRAYITESSATWGLGRISDINSSTLSYTYDSSAGSGTCAYVIDTGIFTQHPEFEGRATFLANYAGDNNNTDGNGHGTHVAGTIGSKTFGVAKKTQLYAVKVLDANGAGTSSGAIAGINFVANDTESRSCPNGAIANMSFGGPKSAALNSAVANAVAAGVFMAVAAGNSAQDASNFSPASEASAFTVGASDSSNTFAYFSDY